MTDRTFSDCSTSDDDPMALLGQPDTAPAAAPAVERWLVSRLRPNQFNSEVFSDSLGAESIAQLADSMRAHGQLSPIVVTPQGVIVDGERRWRAATQLGLSHVAVVVAAHTEQSIRAIVLDACTGTRRLSLREQTSVYCALLDHLREQHGRPQGRPGKTVSKEIDWRDPEEIKSEAAKRAGFTSVMQATRAQAVFSRGAPELQDQVNREAISLSAAYDCLPKRPRSTAADPEPPSSGLTTDDADAPPAAAITGPTEPDGDGASVAPATTTRSDSVPASSSLKTPVQVAKPVTLAPTTVVTAVRDQVRPAPVPAVPTAQVLDAEPAEVTLDDHLMVLRDYLEQLCDTDPDSARDLAKEWADALLAAAGWPPSGEDAYSGMNAPEEDDNCQDDIQDDEAPEPEDEAPLPRKKRPLTLEEELERLVGKPVKR